MHDLPLAHTISRRTLLGSYAARDRRLRQEWYWPDYYGKTRADLKCDETVRLWLDKLADFAVALGDDVTEVVSTRSIVFHEPTWFVELLPRANGIDIRLACEATELATVAAGVQVTAQWAWIANSAVPGTEGSLYYINSDAKFEAACALIRKAYELASDET